MTFKKLNFFSNLWDFYIFVCFIVFEQLRSIKESALITLKYQLLNQIEWEMNVTDLYLLNKQESKFHIFNNNENLLKYHYYRLQLLFIDLQQKKSLQLNPKIKINNIGLMYIIQTFFVVVIFAWSSQLSYETTLLLLLVV